MIFINDISAEEQIELKGLEAGILQRMEDIRVLEERRKEKVAEIAGRVGVDRRRLV